MLVAPEDLAVEAVEIEEQIESWEIELHEFQMGTYTNLIKGQRDKDI
jgi:hypothetical protein